ncbi:ABC transporter substrate-binding protein [Marinomonas spartinae]|uniref:ABC transporter substrate-binding protein n=1 Tax=Marinomonas spartinae TaxID=1792290 RepID=UPI0018F19203|nr:ABC transporter substrate-binding protein [Marinomonas spartinae]MBJ7555566.1 ABC transporter substrate-binding protein [Marinomonas spartinae]
MKLSTKNGLTALATGLLSVSSVSAFAADSFDLQALIEAAQKEPPLIVYASTGKIVKQAKAFDKKYDLQATGVKAKAPQILEIVSREARAHNVKTGVILLEDAPAGIEQLLSKGYVESWVPPDLAKHIPANYQHPLTVVLAPNVWAYNTKLYKTCPITNIWQLTEPKWRGKVAMQDPLGKPAYTDWFNQMATHHDKAVAAAYQAEFGKPLKTDESSATAAFVKALAENGPLLTSSDTAAAAAIGAPDVTNSFVGLISTAKFRKNKDGMKLGLCKNMVPFSGWSYPTLGLIVKGSQSPNAAKLFIHYVMTAQGIAPQSIDGKMSTNQTVSLPKNEPSGVGKVRNQIMGYEASSADSDWQSRQDWQDLWSLSYHK